MTQRKPPKSTEEFVSVLDRLDDSVSMDAQEVKLLLDEARIDPAVELKRAMALIDATEARSNKARFDQADRHRRAELDRLARERTPRSRVENVARLRQLAAKAPPGSPLHANFKNYEAVSDADLDAIVAEFEHLLGLDDDD